MTDEERSSAGVMLLRKNSKVERKSSSNSFLAKSKSTQSLTDLIRHRGSYLEAAGENRNKPLTQNDQSTPAMNKLVAMLRKEEIPTFGNTGNINESSKLNDTDVQRAIEEEN